MWNTQIPKKEVENILSVYWQMLREIEVHCNDDVFKKHLVDSAYEVLNRCKITDTKPRYY